MEIGGYLAAKRAAKLWGSRPSGLGYFDIKLYLRLGREIEMRAIAERLPRSVLDLGTYFGHSAFTILQGAKQACPQPAIRILSLDLFEQPAWMMSMPEVAKFVAEYGSWGKEGIQRSLIELCKKAGLPHQNLTLQKQDVCELTAGELSQFAPEGFGLVAIDCGKTPEVMNNIARLICDPKVTRVGAVLCFQDLFDWHAPWNLFAFYRLLALRHIRIRSVECELAPLVEVAAHGDPGVICEPIEHREPAWLTRYASAATELAAFDAIIQLFRDLKLTALVWRVECLRIGALIRADRLDEAEARVRELDACWPPWLRDGSLHEAYRRYAHIRSGVKDLSVTLATPSAARRNSPLARMLQMAYIRSALIRPPRSIQKGPPIFDGPITARQPLGHRNAV